jgi:serine/threonine-protein kinase
LGHGIELQEQLVARADGSLWAAYHHGLQQRVAVKLLYASLARCERTAVLRFHREAKLMARLRSAHVARILEHGLDDARCPFIVMELLDGCDLETLLAREGRRSIEQTGRLVLQLTAALGEAHTLGMVHRAVTADNVFVLRSAAAYYKLLDFGVARHDDQQRITQPGISPSPAGCIAPEQLVGGQPADRRADLWALGVLAYTSLTGDRPFTEPNTFAALHAFVEQVRSGVALPPSRHPRVSEPVSAALDAWFAKAMAYDPTDRFASAEEMARAWSDAVDDPFLEEQLDDSSDAIESQTRGAHALARHELAQLADYALDESITGIRLSLSELCRASRRAPTSPTPPPEAPGSPRTTESCFDAHAPSPTARRSRVRPPSHPGSMHPAR